MSYFFGGFSFEFFFPSLEVYVFCTTHGTPESCIRSCVISENKRESATNVWDVCTIDLLLANSIQQQQR